MNNNNDGLSDYACSACRHLKKKCDRRKPQCSLCQRHDRACSYPLKKAAVPSESPRDSLRESLVGSQSPIAQTQEDASSVNGFPAVYFTDSDLFQRLVGSIPDMNLPISVGLQSLVGDGPGLRTCVESFFQYANPWAPLISRRNFMQKVLNPLNRRRIDSMLLIVAVRLLMTVSDGDPRTACYCNLKAALLEVELKGAMTFRILQTLVLVAIYELGHSIYPSAYLTIGYCARYGIALGVDQTIISSNSTVANLADTEEERRTWWAIIFLDRYLNIGCPERTSLIEEPSSTSILPMDDKLWDMGVSPPSPPLTMCSPPSEAMGRFGLTVQAAFLLGRVLRFNYLSANGHTIEEDEVQILDNTLAALTKVTLQEGRDRAMGVCCPTTICHRYGTHELL
ncbi:hypothetical protein F5884DRAFT_673623 [Xylogone sp. PMI_703]|nr:hypothetical protein F5884DRAFT_673623 [Xylogone sp. PMI_703]